MLYRVVIKLPGPNRVRLLIGNSENRFRLNLERNKVVKKVLTLVPLILAVSQSSTQVVRQILCEVLVHIFAFPPKYRVILELPKWQRAKKIPKKLLLQ